MSRRLLAARELEGAADFLGIEPGEQPPSNARACFSVGGHAQVQLVSGDARAQRSEQRRRSREVVRPRQSKPQPDLTPVGWKVSNHGVPLGN